MTLLFKVDSLGEVDEALHSLYEEKEGAFFLKVSGLPAVEDISGLKESNAKLLAEKKEQQRKAAEAEAERKRIEEEAARKNGDVEAIENSWREKYSKRESELTAKEESLRKEVYKLTVGREAKELAVKLALKGSDAVLLPHIQQRITLDENNKIRVLDLQGNPSALTIDELEQEFRSNTAFAPLIAAQVGSGGGATGGFGGGAAKNPSEMTVTERAQLLRENPEKFNELFKK